MQYPRLESIARKANLTNVPHKSRWLDKNGNIKDVSEIPAGHYRDKFGRNGICLNFGKDKIVIAERFPGVNEVLVVSSSFDMGELAAHIDLEQAYKLTLASQTIGESESLSAIANIQPIVAIELVINNNGGSARVTGLTYAQVLSLMLVDKDTQPKMVVGGYHKMNDGTNCRASMSVENMSLAGAPKLSIYADRGTDASGAVRVMMRNYAPLKGDSIEVRVCKTSVRTIRKVLEGSLSNTAPIYHIANIQKHGAMGMTFELTQCSDKCIYSLLPETEKWAIENYDIEYRFNLRSVSADALERTLPINTHTALAVLHANGHLDGEDEVTVCLVTDADDFGHAGHWPIHLSVINIEAKSLD